MEIMTSIAELLKKKPAEITLDDIQMKIPSLRRLSDQWERQAVEEEKESLRLRGEAFKPGGTPAQRAALMRQAGEHSAKAADLEKQAEVFLTQLGNFRALETTMSIVRELQELNFISKSTRIQDWQAVMDSMSVEMAKIADGMQALSDALGQALPEVAADSPQDRELEALFEKLDQAQSEEEKATLIAQINQKAGMVF